MGDPELGKGIPINTMNNSISTTAPARKLNYGFSPTYICSFPGFFRILNIAFGIIAFGLWLPGYAPEFLGERINLQTGDTEKGYGNGWVREPLNQFVLAAIVICLFTSIFLLIALIVVKQASVGWNRFNMFIHLGLGLFMFMAAICAFFGVWYFNGNCCHVSMDWEGAGFTFSISRGEGNYVRHCYCYLTKYLNSGDQYKSSVKETVLYDAIKNPLSEFDHRWTFAAHDLNLYLNLIPYEMTPIVLQFILFINSAVYFVASVFSKSKH